MSKRINNIIIVGGGTAGWMTAASLSKFLGTQHYTITLVESADIGTVGVGEATIPPILIYNYTLGLDEASFVRETKASFKLGIEFVDWKKIGHRFFHPFGKIGVDTDGILFTHYWLRWKQQGGRLDFSAFNAETEAAMACKFSALKPESGPKLLPDINYAYHFDASLYANFLRKFSESHGVKRIEGKVETVSQHPDTGFIQSLTLANGELLTGDLFIDCSGFRGLLIEQVFHAGYQDWSHWLPVNQAVAIQSQRTGPLLPYTRATARSAGWQWRIPLQHRTGNGYVYCDQFLHKEKASSTLLATLDGEAISEPRHLSFVTGVRKKFWIKNCVAIGLSSGFLEPLESTSIHLIQESVIKLLSLFPREGFDEILRRKYNSEMAAQYNEVKDFLIAHYVTSEREDTPFWRYVKNMAIPDSLKDKLDLFSTRGETLSEKASLFRESSWFSVLYGQGMRPKSYHPVAETMSNNQLNHLLKNVRLGVLKRSEMLGQHEDYLRLAGLIK